MIVKNVMRRRWRLLTDLFQTVDRWRWCRVAAERRTAAIRPSTHAKRSIN